MRAKRPAKIVKGMVIMSRGRRTVALTLGSVAAGVLAILVGFSAPASAAKPPTPPAGATTAHVDAVSGRAPAAWPLTYVEIDIFDQNAYYVKVTGYNQNGDQVAPTFYTGTSETPIYGWWWIENQNLQLDWYDQWGNHISTTSHHINPVCWSVGGLPVVCRSAWDNIWGP